MTPIDSVFSKTLDALTEPVSLVLFLGLTVAVLALLLFMRFYKEEVKYYRDRDEKRAEQTTANVNGLVGSLDKIREVIASVHLTLAVMKDREGRDR